MDKRKKTGIIIGIIAISLMAMGVVGVAGSMSLIAAHYQVSDTMVSGLISIPCIVVIIVTLITGKLMEYIPEKWIAIIGAVCFIVGGVVPVFFDDLILTFVFRGIMGIGVAVAQVCMTAFTAEFFEGAERKKVQGAAQAAQMAGMCIMCVCSGFLAEIRWNYCYLVHLIGVISLICTLVFIPMKKPVGKRKEEQSRNTEQVAIQKVHITKGCIGWAVLMFVYFIACQAYSTNLSFILDEKGIGTSSASGVSLAVFAISGLIAGLVYSKVEQVGKNKVVSLAALIAIVQYFLLIMAQDLTIVYIGSFVGGFAVSFFMPQIFLYTGHSVDPFSVPMAVAIVTCAQNLGQFVCPYCLNPIANAFAGTSGIGVNVMKYILCIVIFAVCGIIMLFYGIKKDRKTIS